ncbi:Taurine catabolism dioxygenase TauD/TfdA [Niveomyces insectorum RCEF 264]|uniref:Taurine catabolism dioxygenase TauD/TfdA n=1 Tax=Niveomyces insectorum RCEF 264 TaxID=1081102 RepID=A0A167T3D6_9HYPO|nr:Taurine catabolism dioxygenase TauD/TfdA [Niveomyces insectorum RCEF 264]
MTPSVTSPVEEAESTSHTDSIFRQDFDSSLHQKYRYASYLPVWNPINELPPLEAFDFVDKGALADKAKPHLLSAIENHSDASITNITPRVGSEIVGLQLSQLTDEQKNELALLIAERGVVIFRKQDFKDIGPQKQKEFAQYFGQLHVHPVEAQVAGHPELYSIYVGPDNTHRAKRSSSRLTNTRFHSDVSYEHQPPAYTILTMLHSPSTGGDTAWVSTAAAYDRLSPPIRGFLSGLRAEHSGLRQAAQAQREGHPVLRAPVTSEHPIVRVHPATGAKSLFVNVSNTTRIVGLREEESEALLSLLFRHLSTALDCQVRVRWEEDTVALWDNRATVHTPIPDFSVAEGVDQENQEPIFRHAFRITTVGEQPFGVKGLQTVW